MMGFWDGYLGERGWRGFRENFLSKLKYGYSVTW